MFQIGCRKTLQKETFLWQALKEKLKLIFDKIAPPAATINFLPMVDM